MLDPVPEEAKPIHNREVTSEAINDEKDGEKFRELLEALYQKYGYDFRQYSEAHIKRRIRNRMMLSGIQDISEMQYAFGWYN